MNQFMAHVTRWVETHFETLQFSIDFPLKLMNRIFIDYNMTILNLFPANTYETTNEFQNLIERVQKIERVCSLLARKMIAAAQRWNWSQIITLLLWQLTHVSMTHSNRSWSHEMRSRFRFFSHVSKLNARRDWFSLKQTISMLAMKVANRNINMAQTRSNPMWKNWTHNCLVVFTCFCGFGSWHTNRCPK